MTLDRWIAILFLIFSFVYGYAAFHYPLPVPEALHKNGLLLHADGMNFSLYL